jgi:hypothetical protein
MNLVQLMDLEPNTDRIDIDFVIFLAESIATLDFKVKEEILHIIYYLNQILAVGGESMARKVEVYTESEEALAKLDSRDIFLASIYLSMLRLKHYLKKTYSVSDVRCQSYIPSSSKHPERPIAISDTRTEFTLKDLDPLLAEPIPKEAIKRILMEVNFSPKTTFSLFQL